MRFFPREICEKLIKMGCVSMSKFIYYDTDMFPVFNNNPEECIDTPAFTLLDFLETEPYAWKNCRLFTERFLELFVMIPIVNQDGSLGKTVSPKLSFSTPSEIFREVIIKSPDGIAYITNLLIKGGR